MANLWRIAWLVVLVSTTRIDGGKTNGLLDTSHADVGGHGDGDKEFDQRDRTNSIATSSQAQTRLLSSKKGPLRTKLSKIVQTIFRRRKKRADLTAAPTSARPPPTPRTKAPKRPASRSPVRPPQAIPVWIPAPNLPERAPVANATRLFNGTDPSITGTGNGANRTTAPRNSPTQFPPFTVPPHVPIARPPVPPPIAMFTPRPAPVGFAPMAPFSRPTVAPQSMTLPPDMPPVLPPRSAPTTRRPTIAPKATEENTPRPFHKPSLKPLTFTPSHPPSAQPSSYVPSEHPTAAPSCILIATTPTSMPSSMPATRTVGPSGPKPRHVLCWSTSPFPSSSTPPSPQPSFQPSYDPNFIAPVHSIGPSAGPVETRLSCPITRKCRGANLMRRRVGKNRCESDCWLDENYDILVKLKWQCGGCRGPFSLW